MEYNGYKLIEVTKETNLIWDRCWFNHPYDSEIKYEKVKPLFFSFVIYYNPEWTYTKIRKLFYKLKK